MQDRLVFTQNIVKTVGTLAQTMRTEASRDDFISTKGIHDFVTIADKTVENTIRSAISESYPNDNILGEEAGYTLINENMGYWIIDPIDGTNNYMRGTPDWGVIIAYVKNDVIRLGVIYLPDQDIMVWATKGGGAFINGDPVQLSCITDPSQAMATIGYNHKKPYALHMQLLNTIFAHGYEYRRLGCAGVSCVRLAQGCCELYYEGHINAWDIFAGLLIVSEAGGYAHHAPISELMHNPGPVFISNGQVNPDPFIDLMNDIKVKHF